jgi:CubicO group peptidase (beta-lactamase class C family)
LFSTVSDLSLFAQMMLNGGSYNGVRIVADSTVQLFTKRAAGTRALGWDTCAGSFGCGKYFGAEAYGHTGYTGTSLWIDPDRDMFVILLTNRVHAARARRPAKVISDVRADLADAAALAVTDVAGGPIAMPRSFRADRAVGWNKPERSARGRHKGKHSSSKSSAHSSRSKSGKASASKSSKSKVSSSKAKRVVASRKR